MSHKLVYTGALGPAIVTFGAAGTFVKDQPRVIEDDALAAQLIAKGCVTAVTATKKTTPQEG